ncbi:MAG: ATP F0F1 synthase subunit B [Alphaproteobacteria bacterium]|nr:MAG: ATP F0F1 synthase subunit B [Alphaproteobacteria bacterium]
MELLYNVEAIVITAFVLFLALLVWAKAPATVIRMLDARAERIRNELDEARQLREEAQSLLASYERKQREVEKLAEDIVARAVEESREAIEAGKAELERAVARRLKAAEEQIASAEAGAIRQVRDQAIAVAVAAAAEVMARNMPPEKASALIDDAIRTTGERLH